MTFLTHFLVRYFEHLPEDDALLPGGMGHSDLVGKGVFVEAERLVSFCGSWSITKVGKAYLFPLMFQVVFLFNFTLFKFPLCSWRLASQSWQFLQKLLPPLIFQGQVRFRKFAWCGRGIFYNITDPFCGSVIWRDAWSKGTTFWSYGHIMVNEMMPSPYDGYKKNACWDHCTPSGMIGNFILAIFHVR